MALEAIRQKNTEHVEALEPIDLKLRPIVARLHVQHGL